MKRGCEIFSVSIIISYKFILISLGAQINRLVILSFSILFDNRSLANQFKSIEDGSFYCVVSLGWSCNNELLFCIIRVLLGDLLSAPALPILRKSRHYNVKLFVNQSKNKLKAVWNYFFSSPFWACFRRALPYGPLSLQYLLHSYYFTGKNISKSHVFPPDQFTLYFHG